MIALLLAALAFAEPETALQPDPVESVAEEPEYNSAAGALLVLTGRFSNAQQYGRIPEEWRREPAAGNPYPWLDLQYATHTRVEAPELGEHVIYLEWRSGAEDGPISRQRIWVLREDDDGVLTGFDFFTLRDPEPFAGRAEEDGAFAALTADGLIGYPEGCLAISRPPAHVGYHFAVEPGDCVITAQSGTQMRIHASVRAGHSYFTYRESGVTPDSRIVFQVPGAPEPYTFLRLPDED